MRFYSQDLMTKTARGIAAWKAASRYMYMQRWEGLLSKDNDDCSDLLTYTLFPIVSVNADEGCVLGIGKIFVNYRLCPGDAYVNRCTSTKPWLSIGITAVNQTAKVCAWRRLH